MPSIYTLKIMMTRISTIPLRKFFVILGVLCFNFVGFAQHTAATSLSQPGTVIFKNIDHPEMVKIFFEVYDQFEDLDKLEIFISETKFNGSTMQAQPRLSLTNFFGVKRQFKIEINRFVKTTDLPVSELPETVLKGWFAHELGHIVDYQCRSNLDMVLFGIKYLISNKFKRRAEFAADQIAISYGMADEIIAMKKYLTESDFIHDDYKAKINKFYMSLADIDELLRENVTRE